MSWVIDQLAKNMKKITHKRYFLLYDHHHTGNFALYSMFATYLKHGFECEWSSKRVG